MTDVDDDVLDDVAETTPDPSRVRLALGTLTVAAVGFTGGIVLAFVLALALWKFGVAAEFLALPSIVQTLATSAVLLPAAYLIGGALGWPLADRLWLTPAERRARRREGSS